MVARIIISRADSGIIPANASATWCLETASPSVIWGKLRTNGELCANITAFMRLWVLLETWEGAELMGFGEVSESEGIRAELKL